MSQPIGVFDQLDVEMMLLKFIMEIHPEIQMEMLPASV
jgi:hypothetical protein